MFLLFLRDPTIKQLVSLESLIQYFFESTKIASDLSEYFFQSKGKGLVFIFDGYDEMSEEDRNNSLVAKIISRNMLSECDLVITSRPSASLYLRDVADCRVEVLGFTEEDRLDYIQHALKGTDHKIEALQFYLQSNSTINALCYVPLNMTILLCLFEEVECISHSALNSDNKEDIGLPNTQTEMYEKFILMTITRFIKKSDKTFSGKCLIFSDLPEAYYKAFNELLYLAYYALTKDQIVFSYNDEVIQACPILKSGNWEGLGLLKVTEYVNNVSFHFLHFSIQEYLAAYYIASQSDNFQVQLLKDTFWDIHYFNTWIMYVGMTGGKKIAWKHFISGNRFMLSTKLFKSSKISKRYLSDKIKSLHLFQCFAEIGNKELPGKVFKDKIIDLNNQTLLPRDINTICFFLLRSVNKCWIKLDLSNCNIGDIGSDILCKTFLDKSRDIVGIDKVDLSYNQLQSHSILELLDVFKVWHASQVVIYGSQDDDRSLFESCLNKFSLYDDKDFSQAVLIGPYMFAYNVDIHNQIINSTNITTGLYLNHCNYPSTNFKYEELSNKLKLSKLHIIGENISCHFIATLVQTVKEVDSVYIYDHTQSDRDVNYISFMLSKINSNKLGVWVVIGRTKIQGNIPDMFTLNKQFSPIEICNLGDSIKRLCSSSTMSTTKFNKYIHFESKSVFEDFFYLLHEVNYNCEIDFCLLENNLLIANGVEYGRFHNKIISSNKNLISIFITKCKLNAAEFTNLIGKQKSLEKLYIFDSFLDIHSFEYEHLLNQTLRLKELFIHNTNSSCTLTFDLLEAKECYQNVSVLLIVDNILIGHNPTCEQILLSSKLKANLTVWKINNFPLNIELLQKIANTLSNVIDLNIIGCNLEENEFQQCNDCGEQHSDYRISKKPIDNISKILSYFTKLKILSLCHNNLQEAVAGKIFKYLNISNLSKLNISHNEIDEQAVDDTAKVLTQICKLEELDLSCNNLQTTEVVTLLSEVQNTSSCTKLNISHSNIDDNIATFLSRNTQLKELDLSHSNLQTMDAIAVCKGMSSLLHLTKLNISNNDITDAAAADIAVVLSQNILIEELDLSYNNLGVFGSLHIFHSMRKLSTLIKLNVCSIGLTKLAAVDIVNVLNNNNKLQELDLSHNDIQATGATTIFKMASITSLNTLIFSHNNISDNVDFLAFFLSRNTNLKEVDFSHNSLQTAGAIKVCSANLSKLIKFNISHNSITIDALDDIGAFLSHNTKLQKLDLSGNDLQELGDQYVSNSLLIVSNLKDVNFNCCNLSTSDTVIIFKGMKDITSLKILNIGHNMITDEAAETISTVLSYNNKLQSLDLSCNYFTSDGFIKIFKHIKNIVYLRKLNISSNDITIKAAHSIATFLCLNSKLEELDLSNAILQTPGAIIIFKSLRQFSNFRKLFINKNMITDEAADDIAVVLSQSTKLEELDISCNNLQTAGIIQIFESIKHISTLTKLDIAHNMVTDEAREYILDGLSSNSKLKELNLSHIKLKNAINFNNIKLTNLLKFMFSNNNIHEQFTNEFSHFLSHCTNLKVLDLSFTNLDFEVFNGQDIFSLTKFDISGNSIPTHAVDNIAIFLSKNDKLEELNLSCNELKELGVRNILDSINLSNLTRLSISNNQITHLKYITDILTRATRLVELDMSYNHLRAEGMINFLYQTKSIFTNLVKLNISGNIISDGIAQAFANVLLENSQLKELNLSDNNLHTEGIRKIFDGLKISSLIKLHISHNNITEQAADYMAIFLSRNKKLEELDLSHNNLQSPGAIKIFRASLPRLTVLNISHNDITTRAANDVATFLSSTKLEKLNLSHNHLLSDGIIKLCKANLSKLTAINISHNGITVEAKDDIATFLSHNTKLQVLDLSCSELQRSGCLDIFKVLQSISVLASLKISNCNINNEAADELATVLLNNTLLQELDLSCNDLSKSDSVTILKGMKNISNLIAFNINHNTITDEAAEELVTVVRHNPLLQVLNLSYGNLSTSDAMKILKGIKNISNLVTLNISHNMITDEAVDNLVCLLFYNTSLKEIDLSSNHISASSAIKVFKGMEKFSSLEAINISHNMVTDKAAENIATVLSHNNKLKSLNLSSNYFTSEGFVKIFDGMENIVFLKNLSIGSNEIIASEAINGITTVLSHNLELEELDLSNSFIQTAGVTKIFKGLRNISNLRKICIRGNNITDEAADDIADVLSQNTKLKEIDIGSNNLQTTSAIKIFQGIMHIFTLTKFDIAYNMITNEATAYIMSILSNNNVLKELNLSHNNIVISDFAKCNFTNLQELDLSYTNLQTVLGIKDLEVATLQKCNISGHCIPTNNLNGIAGFLFENDELQELDLSCNNLQGMGTRFILEFLNISNLTKLNISNNSITSDLSSIVNALVHATKLVQLDLSYNALNSDNIEYILYKAKSVFVHSKILNLSGNEIRNGAATALANVLSDNSKLKELNLCNTNLQTEEMSTLRFPYLTKLCISHNDITHEAAESIAALLSESSGLKELDLSYNNLKSVGIMKICRINLQKLYTLNISHNGITTQAANDIKTFLSHNLELQALDISCSDLLETGCRSIFTVLKSITTLCTLKLTNCHVINEAADELATTLFHNSLLHELDLSYNNLSTSDAVKIFNGMKNISHLMTLNISHNMITDEAAEIIATVLSHNNKLQSLNLSYNYFTSKGFVKIFEHLQFIMYLRSLNISHNEITIKAAHSIATFLTHNSKLEELDLSNAILQTAGIIVIFKSLRYFSNLKKVYINGTMITDEAADDIAAVLSQNTELEELDIGCNHLQRLVAMIICRASLMNLTTLNISHNGMTAESAHDIGTFLSRNTKLEKLNLSHNHLSSAIRICRTSLTDLTTLNISHNDITAKTAYDIATLLSGNTKLEKLDLSHNNLSAGIIMICKTKLTKLTTLDISHNGITVEATKDIAAFLSHSTKLQFLDLSCNNLQESGCVNIFKVLQHTSVLSSLKVSDCGVIGEAADELATVLLHNILLQELDLSYNNLSKLDILKVLKGMKNTSNLVTINVSHNKIIDEAADGLAIVLRNNTKLEKLDLSFNDLSNSDIVKICKGMKNISYLKEINIGYNMITDKAADSIAIVLSHNSKLQKLNMPFSNLSFKGFIEIFNGMKKILYLSHLNISHSKITGEATGSIAAVLSHNTKIEELDISYNDLQTSGAIKIFQSIKHTSTLTKLNIAHNMITGKATEHIINILYNNTELKELNLSDNILLEKGVIIEIMVNKLRFINEHKETPNKQPRIISNLQELDLSNISSLTLVIKVLKELIHNSALTKVNISRHPITQSAAYDLAIILSKNNHLQELIMSYNNLEAGDINTILGTVKSSNLTKLNISANCANLEAVVNVLLQHTNLVELDLSYNRSLNAANVTRFFSITKNIFINLIKLNISGIFCDITDEAATDLAYIFSQNNKLNELDLSDNSLNPEAASRILNGLNTSTLIKFRISHNNINDEVAGDIANFLSKCTNLEELDLSCNSLQDIGAIEISRANISSLISFNISHNNITIKAADDVANFLSRNSQIQTFDISCNGLLETGVRNILKDMQVVQSIFNLSVLNISEGSVISETVNELVSILLCNTGLKEFDLSYNSLFMSDSINILQGMKNVSNLVTINLSHTYITDEAADELATVLLHNTSLQNIDLSYNNLSTSDAIKIFKGMKNISRLEAINISHNMITDEAADELANVLSHNNDLEIFYMSSNCFSSEGCIKIMNGMSNTLYLKKTDISCNQITHKAAGSIATFLSRSSKLEELILNCNDFQKSYLFERFKSEKLIKFHVSFALLEVDDIATVLMHNTELEDLNLSNNELLSDGIIRICLTMKNILNLKRIDISHNWITGEAADDIANILSQNTNLQELYLSNNYLQSHGIVTMFNRMSTVSKITHLDISSNRITDEAADEIADFLLHNSNLKVLDLSNNLIQAAGARIIFGKSTNYSLKKLNVSLNAVDDEAADIVASFLSQNPSLGEFDVSKNDLQAIGAVKIFKAIQSCPNICKVNMSNNRISDEAGDEIAYVLSTVTKLQEVDLDCNLLSAEMSDYIKRAFIMLPYKMHTHTA